MKAPVVAVLVSAITLSAACVGPAVSPGAGSAADVNWSAHNGNSNEWAYSVLTQINRKTVSRLGLAWYLDLDGQATLEGTPLEVDGVVYFTDTYADVYAVDAVSGKVLWKFEAQTWKSAPGKMMWNFAANRGAAYENGRIFSATLDGRLLALDAKTGALLWTAQTVPVQGGKTVTGAPRTFNGKVIVGNGGADFGERGYVTAYDTVTGHQLWRFYLAPGTPQENAGDPAMQRAAATWSGEYWKTGTGGAAWDSITFDSELNQIYVGAGNAGPYDTATRNPQGGDNLYTSSIVALNADTGQYLWHYQTTPNDTWDYDATQQIALTDLVINGQSRKVLMQAPKNGFFYILDRHDGKLLSAEKFTKVTWADHIDLNSGRPVEAPGARYALSGDATVWPGTMGAHGLQSMSYSPNSGLVYIPEMQLASSWHKGQPIPGLFALGNLSLTGHIADPQQDDHGALLAWDPVAQKARWRVVQPTLWNGGVVSTAGGVVFEGTGDGYLHGYDAGSGEELWRFNTGLGIIAPPMTYAVNGKQYVSVLVGYGGSAAVWGKFMEAGWKFSSPRRLLTFALDRNTALPASPAAHLAVSAVDDPTQQFKPEDVMAGQAIYNLACAACHGLNLVSAGAPAPDLRESRLALTEQGLWSVVHDGALMSAGMPQLSMLPRPQLDQIYAYIRTGAREALAQNHGADASPLSR
jgi:quinohemoprotein ethanol dehydrogenase